MADRNDNVDADQRRSSHGGGFGQRMHHGMERVERGIQKVGRGLGQLVHGGSKHTGEDDGGGKGGFLLRVRGSAIGSPVVSPKITIVESISTLAPDWY